ncbi:MAG: hypothetical protein J1E40_01990 [Oscillospiraceae bacterium]|nr:hypothetical protein [Oscillospiraceae bacterium]
MDKVSVYLDNCCYNRPYDNQTQIRVRLETQAKLHIQKLIVEKKINLVYSYISVYENLKNPDITRRLSITDFFNHAAVFVDTSKSDKVTEIAAQIIETGVKKMDALHVASAIIGKADYFLTTDIRLLKYSTDKIHIINPIDFSISEV